MPQAGKWLVGQMKQRGGTDSEYTDLEYGQVISTQPLQIMLQSNLMISEQFLELSMLVKPLSVNILNIGNVQIWRGLQANDKVRLIRYSRGQRYFVLERL